METLARWLYTLLLYAITPLIPLRLLWRSRKAPAYRQRWSERFGFIQPLAYSGCIWIHAVSVGEVRAALPLVQAFRERYRQIDILITTMTPTGSEQVRTAFADIDNGDNVHHVYLPYDLPSAVNRFLQRTQPRIAIIMETELWPNLFQACADANIPLVVANARLSERSVQRYLSVIALIQPTLQCASLIAAQNMDTAQRFQQLGAIPAQIHVTGNIKYDISIPSGLQQQGQQLRQQVFGQRPIWIAASTHDGEDEQILQAFKIIRQQLPETLLLLVPRHPERFRSVAELCQRHGFNLIKRSSGHICDKDTQVFIGDSMGELLLFYASADVAFVGGSLIEIGGHNVLEPALLGLPVVFGPHMFNFIDASQHLLQAQAAWQVENSQSMAQITRRLLIDQKLRELAGQRGKDAVEANRGALAELFSLIEDIIALTPSPDHFLIDDNKRKNKKGESI